MAPSHSHRRFDLEAVRVPAEGKQKERHVEAWAAGNKQQQPTGKVRAWEGLGGSRGASAA